MKTPDEIKIWLATEIAVHYHLPNPEPRLTPKEFMFLEKMHGETLAYIERLEADNESKQKRIDDLESRLAQVERERDAAIDDLRHSFDPCTVCKNQDICEQYCPENDYNCPDCKDKHRCICHNCTADNDLWEWRGLCEENTHDQPSM